ncbi:hypothetical protein ADIARSV_0870 [Arcticibacter svalbardensis MN12-7]|uniref:Uncharacterized protein n=1 Tax=Arcticibacter svalbardensis MN12-7 TaxID=1150600 RepID=R9GWN3_9SPHI|nr:hypothetical protein ADIARSV_0870 [Arcticibacter svalbardensis MN12-7]
MEIDSTSWGLMLFIFPGAPSINTSGEPVLLVIDANPLILNVPPLPG